MMISKILPQAASRNARRRRLPYTVVLLLAGSISGCSQPLVSHLVTAPGHAASPVVSSQTKTLPLDEQGLIASSSEASAYRLGPNDIISVTVYMHPELSAPQPGVTGGQGGVMITSNGTVGLPLIGNVDLGGLTLEQAQQKLTDLYGADIKSPNVAVQLVAAQSLKYYLFGAFSNPGIKYPGHTLTLLEALSLGGSLDTANADLYQAYVAQGTRKLPIDLHSLLEEGDTAQNIRLASGDTIVVPPDSDEKAFVFGAVSKPGAVPFEAGSLSLLQALSAAGFNLSDYTSARLSQVRVIRSRGGREEFDIVNASKILKGEAMPFELKPGDIVFLPPTDIATWNDALNKLIPSLTTISGILNPFVMVKFLRQ
ncbi:MAG: polysaccharide biosynthesis/export family protein [Sideroxydans sp.]|nr:polysaccharide biosynthesis/export family protein [Gallionella sp.]MDD5059486.1 polysaccharide biosynthesis/export family protein [Sideroxydans sp.]